MTRTFIALGLALGPVLAGAQTAGTPSNRYISDDIKVTLRDAPRNDAASLGSVSSGDKVTLLESLGDDSFARIKTADGRSGWVTARMLSDSPAAREQLTELRRQLAEARAQTGSLNDQLGQSRKQLDAAKPALELAADNDRLQAQLTEGQAELAASRQRYDEAKAQRKTLLVGAGLIGIGVLLGLLLPMLARGKRRRYGDF